jgi:hypothetical protein
VCFTSNVSRCCSVVLFEIPPLRTNDMATSADASEGAVGYTRSASSTYGNFVAALKEPRNAKYRKALATYAKSVASAAAAASSTATTSSPPLPADGAGVESAAAAAAAAAAAVDPVAVRRFLTSFTTGLRQTPAWRTDDDAAWRQVQEGVEKYVMIKLYAAVFSADPADAALDARLTYKARLLATFLDFEHLDIDVEAEECVQAWQDASKALQSINQFKAPRDKMVCLLNCCQVSARERLHVLRWRVCMSCALVLPTQTRPCVCCCRLSRSPNTRFYTTLSASLRAVAATRVLPRPLPAEGRHSLVARRTSCLCWCTSSSRLCRRTHGRTCRCVYLVCWVAATRSLVPCHVGQISWRRMCVCVYVRAGVCVCVCVVCVCLFGVFGLLVGVASRLLARNERTVLAALWLRPVHSTVS